MEYTRRRLEGGSLYALLEQESRDYLRAGAFADADLELLGKAFAKVSRRSLPSADQSILEGLRRRDTWGGGR